MQTLNFEGAVLLDEPERGAAGIWDVKCTNDKIVNQPIRVLMKLV